MPRKDKSPGFTDSLSTRLTSAETDRWLEILRRGRQRDPRATRADIIKALLGMADADPNLLNEEDLRYFRGQAGAEYLPVRVSDEERTQLVAISVSQERPLEYIAHELMLRGLAAYLSDSHLKEPDKNPHRRPVVKVFTEDKNTKESGKRRRA